MTNRILMSDLKKRITQKDKEIAKSYYEKRKGGLLSNFFFGSEIDKKIADRQKTYYKNTNEITWYASVIDIFKEEYEMKIQHDKIESHKKEQEIKDAKMLLHKKALKSSLSIKTTDNQSAPVKVKPERDLSIKLRIIPDVKDTGVPEMERFKFLQSDSDSIIKSKVNYVRKIIKGKLYYQKLNILKYYGIHLDRQRRSNKFYWYGWKNLNERKYLFYVGKKD